MELMKIEKPVYLRVDEKRLLRELPAFFASFEDSLAELIQNAYRAGATRVDLHLNVDERTLTVEDDGSGSTDPQAFLTAGRTGWDESVVTDPAGLGFFSLLGLADQVIVQSRAAGHCGWQMCVTPGAFNGEEVPWDPISEHFGPVPHGTRIEAKLGKQAKIQSYLLTGSSLLHQVRHFFPLEVRMTVVDGGQTYHPDTSLVRFDGPTLETPVGRLVHQRLDSWRCLGGGAVWEHRYLTCGMGMAMKGLIEKMPGGAFLAPNLLEHQLFWLVDERCAVRPKLPDRKELIQNEALAFAFRTLAQSLYESLDLAGLRAAIAALDLPDVVEDYHHPRVCRAAAPFLEPFFRVLPEAVLALCGWETCAYTPYDNCELQEEEEDYYRVWLGQPERQMVRNPLRTNNLTLADALNRAECWTTVDATNQQDIDVQVSGLQVAEVSGFSFGTCDSIVVRIGGDPVRELDALFLGAGAVPVYDEAGEPVSTGCYLTTESPLRLKRDLRDLEQQRDALYGFALSCLEEANCLHDYIPRDSDDAFNSIALYQRALSEWTAVFQPERGVAQARFAALTELNETLRQGTWGITPLIDATREVAAAHPEVTEIQDILAKLRAVRNLQVSAELWNPENAPAAVPE